MEKESKQEFKSMWKESLSEQEPEKPEGDKKTKIEKKEKG